jgi:hypothetical protein
MQNLKNIIDCNLNETDPLWWAAPNEFSDLSWEEFKAGFLGADVTLAPSTGSGGGGSGQPRSRKLLQTPPSSYDWTARGKVTPIRNQNRVGLAAAAAALGLAALRWGLLRCVQACRRAACVAFGLR